MPGIFFPLLTLTEIVSKIWNIKVHLLSLGDFQIIVDEVFRQRLRRNLPQLFIITTEGPELLQLINLSGLWQHEVNDHIP